VTSAVIGLDGGWPDVLAAEHALAVAVELLGPDAVRVACTHLTRIGGPRVVLSLDVADAGAIDRLPPGLTGSPAAADGAAAHVERRSGRAVRYPGQEHLTGVRTAAEIVSASAIERVVAVLAPPVAPAALVDTRGFVRPEWLDGALTLRVAAAPGGLLAPFEIPNPTPCCADHR
jgi:hypothetical protein